MCIMQYAILYYAIMRVHKLTSYMYMCMCAESEMKIESESVAVCVGMGLGASMRASVVNESSANGYNLCP